MVQRKRTNVCCCSAFVWAQAIAWSQTVGFTFLCIFVYHIEEMLPLHEDDPESERQRKMVLDILIILLLVIFVGIIFGIFLLIGIYCKRPGFISAWVVYTILLIAMDTVCIARTIILALDSVVGVSLAGLLFVTLVVCHGFSIWVVNAHLNEMFLCVHNYHRSHCDKWASRSRTSSHSFSPRESSKQETSHVV